MADALKIDVKDNVAVVIREIAKGEKVRFLDFEKGEKEVISTCDIPIYHKIALVNLEQGEKIVKYGEHIGEASCKILAGSHVHTHNVESVRENLKEAL